MANGNHDVLLCESGIRTYETATRHTWTSRHARAKRETHATVIVDPSHAAARPRSLRQMACARSPVADGLIVEVTRIRVRRCPTAINRWHSAGSRANGCGSFQRARPRQVERGRL